MADRPVLELRLGDHVALRKRHPCGSETWRIVRVGADIGLVCDGCARRVLLERRDVERRIARFLERGDDPGTAPAPGPGDDAASLEPQRAAGRPRDTDARHGPGQPA